MALHVNEVAAAIVGCGRTPEVIEAHFVKRGGRSVGGDMATVFTALPVGGHHHRHGVPAEVGLQPTLERTVAGIRLLALHTNGVHIRRIGRVGEVRPVAPRVVNQALNQEVGALFAANPQYTVY